MIYTIIGYYIAAHIFVCGCALGVSVVIGTHWVCEHFIEWWKK